ncbi:ATP-binding protein [Halomonas chromatireducens]|uniref:histidine kinase n=1 Tax=Halomonas chromatireducens TaxID=507626 RepID=A0A0X8HFX7_9GAMM|nr:ATP-binding protein [Halomonas chromatireducens]AMD01906.1 Sensor histidine kinase GlrK [Halomonas chromatireducens]
MTIRLEITPLPYRDDPLGYFSALRQRPGAVLLDSGRPIAPGGRYDIMSSDPLTVLSIDDHGNLSGGVEGMDEDDPFSAQQVLLDSLALELPDSDLPFLGGLIGYWGYDLGRCLEPVGGRSQQVVDLPASRVGLYDWALIQDHDAGETWLVASAQRRGLVMEWLDALPVSGGQFRLLAPFEGELDREGYARRFSAVQDYIRAGDCYQINLAQRFSAPFAGDLWAAYQRLRLATPTPLASVREGSALLSDGVAGELSPRQREILSLIDSSGRELQRLIEQLLDYNLLQHNQRVALAQVDVATLVMNTLTKHRLALEQKRMRVTSFEGPLEWVIDSKAVGRILDNLVSNAIAYGQDGGDLLIRAHAGHDRLVLDVANSGDPIAEDDRPRLFEPFYQGRSRRKGPLKGSGIGLSVAADCARLHNGQLQLVEDRELEVCFRLTLPRQSLPLYSSDRNRRPVEAGMDARSD